LVDASFREIQVDILGKVVFTTLQSSLWLFKGGLPMSARTVSRALLIGAAVSVVGSVLVSSAQADTIYTIGVPNAALSVDTGPYATVDVHLVNATNATITFTSLDNGGFRYLMGAAQVADVNVNAASFSIGSISASNSIPGFLLASGPVSNGGSGNVSAFGNFNQTLDSFDGFGHSSTLINFALTDISGTWADSSSVLKANANGFLAAVHSFACADPCSSAQTNVLTGFAGNSPVPGPIAGAGLPGLVAACGGILVLARRRRQIIA
jgi:hypothetical protein